MSKTSISREFSAGGVVFKIKDKSILWLVTKSAPSRFTPKGFWRLPKGWLDDEANGDTPGPLGRGDKKATKNEIESAAKREVKEEGGIEAKIVYKIITDKFFFTFLGRRILKFVTYYLMEWTRDLKEGRGFETQEIAWIPYLEARKKLKHQGEKKILDKAREKLEQVVRENLL